MKSFSSFCFLSIFISVFCSSGRAQTAPTTLSEIYGPGGFYIDTNPANEKLVVGSWMQGANMPYPRYYSGSVMYTRNDTLWLYVIGGDTTGAGHATTTCLRYNVNTNTWQYIAPLPVPMRTNAATRLGDKIYTMGGFSAPFPAPALNVFFEYDINTNTWTQLPNIPETIFFHGAVGYQDSLIYIIGGILYTPSRTEVWLKSLKLYNTINQTFRPATDMPEATASFAYTVNEYLFNRLYVNGGLKNYSELWNSTYGGEINQNNRAQINWMYLANNPIGVFAHFGAMYLDNKAQYLGGSNTTGFTPIDNVYSYDIDNNTYHQEENLPLKLQGFAAGVSLRHTRQLDIVTSVISGGVTDVRELKGVAISGQTWIYTDTLESTGLNEITGAIPRTFKLLQNYPNPFNPSTTIQFSIPEQTFVKLEVFNSLGEKISTLVSEELNTGNYKYEWGPKNLSSGIYFYKLSSERFSEMKKMILLK